MPGQPAKILRDVLGCGFASLVRVGVGYEGIFDWKDVLASDGRAFSDADRNGHVAIGTFLDSVSHGTPRFRATIT